METPQNIGSIEKMAVPGRQNGIKRLVRQAKEHIRTGWEAVKPGKRAWKGAGYGLLGAMLLLAVLGAVDVLSTPEPNPVGLMVIAGFTLLALLTGSLATLLQGWLKRIPPSYLMALTALAVMLLFFYLFFPPAGLALMLTGSL